MPEKQAEVLAHLQARLLNEQVATKQDLTLRLGSMMVVAISVVAALVELL